MIVVQDKLMRTGFCVLTIYKMLPNC